jgi:hypothetical protein
MKARIAGTTSIAAGRPDAVFVYQALAGVDRRLNDAVTPGIKLRWTVVAEFADADEYIRLRSHESRVGRGEEVLYELAVNDLSALGATLSPRYGLEVETRMPPAAGEEGVAGQRLRRLAPRGDLPLCLLNRDDGYGCVGKDKAIQDRAGRSDRALTTQEVEALYHGVSALSRDTTLTVISVTADGAMAECPLGGEVAVALKASEQEAGDTLRFFEGLTIEGSPASCAGAAPRARPPSVARHQASRSSPGLGGNAGLPATAGRPPTVPTARRSRWPATRRTTGNPAR